MSAFHWSGEDDVFTGYQAHIRFFTGVFAGVYPVDDDISLVVHLRKCLSASDSRENAIPHPVFGHVYGFSLGARVSLRLSERRSSVGTAYGVSSR